jgi:hypothetical protein
MVVILCIAHEVLTLGSPGFCAFPPLAAGALDPSSGETEQQDFRRPELPTPFPMLDPTVKPDRRLVTVT